LYKRNLLLYDRQTDSLWSQLLSQAVTGPLAGTRLSALPAEETTWGEWKKEHPDTKVLSFATGYPRDYHVDPYADYPFPRVPALFVTTGEKSKIYPFAELKKVGSPLADHLGGHSLTVVFSPRSKTARVEGGTSLTWFVSFLDDLKAFFPEAEIFRAGRHRTSIRSVIPPGPDRSLFRVAVSSSIENPRTGYFQCGNDVALTGVIIHGPRRSVP
jgi:hypothetical protein